MVYLLVVAHPDDEVLGAGATMYQLAKEGHQVDVCILSAQASARAGRPPLDELHANVNSCMDILGARHIYAGEFPNIELNVVPHLHLVQFIEKAIVETGADVVITHHPSDLNNDHLQTSLACQAAVRLFQRRTDLKPLRELLFMEVPSSTDWALNSTALPFRANTFVEIGEDGIAAKLKALSQYVGVMRDFPHPRSIESIRGLAAYRGSQAGMVYAEAFESVFRRGL